VLKNNRGFTLIELMIVIAMIGILATIAIPNYQLYMNKTKFTELVQAVEPFKTAVATCAMETGALKACANSENGVPPAFTAKNATTGYTASINTSSAGVITATSQQITAKGKAPYTYSLTPTLETNGQITWTRGGTCVTEGLC
jgi:type IV pilus assembly protein PilA